MLELAKMIILVFDRVENNVGKGENAGYQHFFLFPHYVFKRFLTRHKKSGLLARDLFVDSISVDQDQTAKSTYSDLRYINSDEEVGLFFCRR